MAGDGGMGGSDGVMRSQGQNGGGLRCVYCVCTVCEVRVLV